MKPIHCSNCPLANAPGPVWGVGDLLHAKLIYIGQNPGSEEVIERQPFVGASGRVLNRQLFEAGVRRDELFITNVVKCLTPNNRIPTQAEVDKCSYFLHREISACKADTVVLAGALAFQTLVGSRSSLSTDYKPSSNVMQRMGCVEQFDGRKWIGTIHPAFIMRMPMFSDAPIEHLKKAWKISGCEVPLPQVEAATDKQLEELAAEARRLGRFADDVETDPRGLGDVDEDDYIGGDWAMHMCGFSVEPYKAVVVKPEQLHLWAPTFAEPLVRQYEHNGEYDRFYLEAYAPQLNSRFDTLLAHHWLHNNMRKALKPYVVSMYTNLPYYDRKLNDHNPQLYCGLDNIATLLAGIEMERQLANHGLLELFLNVEMKLQPILESWRREGLRVDVRKMLLFQQVLEQKLTKIEELITKMLGPFFNWHSPKQVADLYYKRWGLPVQYRKREKAGQQNKTITTDSDAREALVRWINSSEKRKEQYQQALIYFQLADAAAETKKLLEYFDRVSPDHRIHAHWKSYGAATYRLVSVPNIQNWPTWPIMEGLPNLRSIVIADHDEDMIISCDFSQMQLWIYAVQFNIKYLLNVYESGDYLYGAAYETCFKRPFFKPGVPRTKKNKGEWVTEQELLRAKAVPLGFLFDRSGESVAAEYGWRSSEGTKLKSDWFGVVPELPKAHAWIKYEMTQNRRLRPPPGVILHYPSPSLQGLNCFAQTPESFILRECILMIEPQLRKLPHGRIMLTVHDSIVCNVHEDYTEEAYETIIKPALEHPISWLRNFRFRHEAKVGKMWDWEMKDYDAWKSGRTGRHLNQTAGGQEVK